VTSELRYTAWGEVRYASGTAATQYTFNGQSARVDEFGLVYFKARWLVLHTKTWIVALNRINYLTGQEGAQNGKNQKSIHRRIQGKSCRKYNGKAGLLSHWKAQRLKKWMINSRHCKKRVQSGSMRSIFKPKNKLRLRNLKEGKISRYARILV